MEEPISPPEHPLIELQRTIGNQAVLRLLVRRKTDTTEESKPWASEADAERYIRLRLKERDEDIRRDFESIETNLGNVASNDESDKKGPLVRVVKNAYLGTGILTLAMIDNLQNDISPVPRYIDEYFEQLRKDVEEKDSLVEGLDNPKDWYLKHELGIKLPD